MGDVRGRPIQERTHDEVLGRDRATDDAWIRAWLEEAGFGVLATVEAGRPFLNPNLFVYDAETHAIYVHTARAGRTRHNVNGAGVAGGGGTGGDGAPATFAAAGMGRLLPGEDYRPVTTGELRRTTVYRLDIESWSGKQKAADPDFPGAFERPAPPVPFRAAETGVGDRAP